MNGFLIYTDPMDTINLLENGAHEKEETEIFRKIIAPGWTVIDCGAHIGYHTLEFARLVGKSGTVYAFEPAPTSFKFLEKNVKVNGFADYVHLFRAAVSDKKSKLELEIEDEKGIPIGAAGYRLGTRGKKRITVDVIALDDVIYKPEEKVNFVKLDVEGYEIKALCGMRKILQDNPVLFIEYHPKMLSLANEKPEDLIDFLLTGGYKLYDAKLKKETTKENLLGTYTQRVGNHTNLLCTK